MTSAPQPAPSGTPEHPSMALLGPLPPPWGGYTYYTALLAESRLAERFGLHCIDSGHPVAVHEMNPWTRWPNLGGLLVRELWRTRRATRIPSIRGVHMIVNPTISRLLALAAEFEVAGRAGWRRIFDIRAGSFADFAESSAAPIQRMLERVIRSAEMVTVEGAPHVDYIASRWGVQAHLQPSFVDWRETGASHRAEPESREGPLRIVYAGRVEASKGIVELVEAVARIHPRVPVSLEIVGAGEGALRGRVDRLIESNGLGEIVYYTGPLPRDEYLAAIQRGQVFAMPTYHSGEGHSNALTEAMAMGLCVVSCDQGFIKDVLGEGGVLVPQRDSAALASVLEALAADPERRGVLGREARRRAKTLYSDEKVLEDWSRLYAALLGPTS